MAKKGKKIFLATAILTAVIAAGLVIFSVFHTESKNDFIRRVEKSRMFANGFSDLVGQPELYRVMYDHIFNNQSQKTPKLLFIGEDGLRADLVTKTKGNQASALNRVYSQGELYLGRAGGKNLNDNPPLTAPGWTAMFTGVWSDVSLVYENKDTMCGEVSTIFYQYRENLIETSFSYSWKNYHEYVYKNEAAVFPEIFKYGKDDDATLENMLLAIDSGQAAIFGIFEALDHAGHNHKFGFDGKRYKEYNRAFEWIEEAANRLLDAVYSRAGYEQEDWLIIMTSDHGGYGFEHYEENIMITTTYFAVNKKVF